MIEADKIQMIWEYYQEIDLLAAIPLENLGDFFKIDEEIQKRKKEIENVTTNN